nr:MAG TPA: hypothetical protein [Caudoviricetes sp.]DAN25575.1 MAG TPA: hypothetical protein [Caudoviricetes sp.]DAP59664.1 MAG TPA: hypothetical protein [Caudoviricetes sp.]
MFFLRLFQAAPLFLFPSLGSKACLSLFFSRYRARWSR